MNCLSIDFHGAPAQERAEYAFSRRAREALYEGFRPLGGCVVLVTCHRTELYFSCPVARAEEVTGRAAVPPARLYLGAEAEEHLFLLAAGLCSMLAGEDEILRQVRDAYEEARAAGVTKGLDETFQAAIACGKDVRTRTKISSFACSVATLAANEVAAFLKEGGSVLVVGGTGKFGASVLKNLAAHRGLTVYAAERTHGVPASVRGDVIPVSYEGRYDVLKICDAAVSATSSPHVVFSAARTREIVQTCPRERLFLDLAMPPDIERGVGELAGCILSGIDGFARRARENNERKRDAIAAAHAVVRESLDAFAASQAAHRFVMCRGRLPASLAALRKTDPRAFSERIAALLGEKK